MVKTLNCSCVIKLNSDTISFSDIPPTEDGQCDHSATTMTSLVPRAASLNIPDDEEFGMTELFKIQIDEETGELVLDDGELHHP